MRKRYSNEILDYARDLDILKADLGMMPPPKEKWNTIKPVEGGHYIAGRKEYIYTNGELVEFIEQEIKLETDEAVDITEETVEEVNEGGAE